MAEYVRKNRCLKCTKHVGFDVYKTDGSHGLKCPNASCNCLKFCQPAVQASQRVRKAQTAVARFAALKICDIDANISNTDAESELGEVFYTLMTRLVAAFIFRYLWISTNVLSTLLRISILKIHYLQRQILKSVKNFGPIQMTLILS